VTKPAIRRLARRGGVKRLSGYIYEELRGELKTFLQKVLTDAAQVRYFIVKLLTIRLAQHFKVCNFLIPFSKTWNMDQSLISRVAFVHFYFCRSLCFFRIKKC
jgi:hypothetical protein